MKIVVVLAVVLISTLLFCFDTVDSAGCHGSASYGNPNNYAIIDGASLAVLEKTVPNGKLYRVTVPQSGGASVSNFTLVHVYGSPYQMGYAQGQLLKNEASTFITTAYNYFISQIESALPNYFPKWLDDMISSIGLDAALDFTSWATAEYTGEWFYEELHGIADASGVDYTTLLRVHMIAGLTQGKCSMFGAWGDSLGKSDNMKLLQLRALDWDMNGPFRDYSQITVYHPSTGNGHDFVNIGLTGFIGGLTGVSKTQLGISEIGVAYPDASFGEESRVGIPFIFLLRDILQFDETLDDAINRMIAAARTCDLILGVGDGKSNEFRGFEYSYSTLKVFSDTNLQPYNQTWHPRIKDIVYWGMDWICPAYNTVLSTLLNKYYGQITPQVAIQYISAVEQSGDNHLAFYDLTDMLAYVSFAAPHGVGGPVPAYSRQFTSWNVTALVSETQ